MGAFCIVLSVFEHCARILSGQAFYLANKGFLTRSFCLHFLAVFGKKICIRLYNIFNRHRPNLPHRLKIFRPFENFLKHVSGQKNLKRDRQADAPRQGGGQAALVRP
jgi:hypothetical protein